MELLVELDVESRQRFSAQSDLVSFLDRVNFQHLQLNFLLVFFDHFDLSLANIFEVLTANCISITI